MQHEFGQMQQELLKEKAGNEGIATKMKKLYSTLRGQVDNKAGFDQVFNDVMNDEEVNGQDFSSHASPSKN